MGVALNVACVRYRTSWEFPEIVVGKYRMISDADGKQYPWYGSKSEVQTLEGPTMQPTHVTIHMNDNFFPQVRLYPPDSYRLHHCHPLHYSTGMWANAQRDGRPAKFWWRPLFNAAKFG